MNKDFIKQHTVKAVEAWLKGVFPYSQIRHGDISRGHGDIVIVNLGDNPFVSFEEYMRHTHDIERIETVGRFTNIWWGSRVINDSIEIARS